MHRNLSCKKINKDLQQNRTLRYRYIWRKLTNLDMQLHNCCIFVFTVSQWNAWWLQMTVTEVVLVRQHCFRCTAVLWTIPAATDTWMSFMVNHSYRMNLYTDTAYRIILIYFLSMFLCMCFVCVCVCVCVCVWREPCTLLYINICIVIYTLIVIHFHFTVLQHVAHAFICKPNKGAITVCKLHSLKVIILEAEVHKS